MSWFVRALLGITGDDPCAAEYLAAALILLVVLACLLLVGYGAAVTAVALARRW